jgi:hypothetical protein
MLHSPNVPFPAMEANRSQMLVRGTPLPVFCSQTLGCGFPWDRSRGRALAWWMRKTSVLCSPLFHKERFSTRETSECIDFKNDRAYSPRLSITEPVVPWIDSNIKITVD